MDDKTQPVPALPGDFAAGERAMPVKPEDTRRRGDFAAGARTKPAPPGEPYGDFAAGERTKPVKPEDEVPGTFADTDTHD